LIAREQIFVKSSYGGRYHRHITRADRNSDCREESKHGNELTQLSRREPEAALSPCDQAKYPWYRAPESRESKSSVGIREKAATSDAKNIF
jgi:hypothetical protein